MQHPARHNLGPSTGAPVIDFSSAKLAVRLADLIADFLAAEREVGLASTAADRFPGKERSPRIFGGTSPASTITVEGNAPVVIPARDWFYTSLEEIDRSREKALESAASESERSKIEERFAGYREEYARHEIEIAQAIPRGKRAAERRLSRAHRAIDRTEDAIINYQPSCPEEAAELLNFVGRSERNHCFTNDDWALFQVMRNAAKALVAAQVD
ncbi:hypothetical protein [Bradyrhizobium sp. LA7.1]|uniref:hypothetical protein n=1 Tax=Bradyrhizobium sp. LA7.1 TaxID=3156324 RepID=UPI0033952594